MRTTTLENITTIPRGASVPPPPVLPPFEVEVDERAARRTLRAQIAKLEAELSHVTASDEAWAGMEPVSVLRGAGPELLSLGDLERARDQLSQRLARIRGELGDHSAVVAANRRLLEAMMLDPGRHKFMRITREDLGERGCGGWEVRPRLGLIGMLAGWWHVVVSSGCPLAT